jgi:hypothetical protein
MLNYGLKEDNQYIPFHRRYKINRSIILNRLTRFGLFINGFSYLVTTSIINRYRFTMLQQSLFLILLTGDRIPLINIRLPHAIRHHQSSHKIHFLRRKQILFCMYNI